MSCALPGGLLRELRSVYCTYWEQQSLDPTLRLAASRARTATLPKLESFEKSLDKVMRGAGMAHGMEMPPLLEPTEEPPPPAAAGAKKPTITAEVLREKIGKMAEKDTFETLSLGGIREVLCTELGAEDLSEHKAAIKEIVTEILSASLPEDRDVEVVAVVSPQDREASARAEVCCLRLSSLLLRHPLILWNGPY